MGISKILGIFAVVILSLTCKSNNPGEIITGAEQPDQYLHLLQDKKVGLVVNHTSIIGDNHLVDFLQNAPRVHVTRIFSPEHGFRGDAPEGEKVKDRKDPQTGLPIVSLYGENKKPTPDQLKDLDILIFDIQDVGARFYTYISTLHLVMEACAENGVPLIIFDRPNPNGDYIAGPVLNSSFQSFVGMHPIPVVHGCTIGELAQMVNGEKWLKNEIKCNLTIIPVQNYSHKMRYILPVPPSPNLPNDLAVRLYPSLCFFEATSISVGRGTEFPFQVIGGLNPDLGDFKFTPEGYPDSAIKPLHEGKTCYGIDLRKLETAPTFTLKFFLDFYARFENKEAFLTREQWFNLLAGNDQLILKIKQSMSEKEIEQSWQTELNQYKQKRKKYLLYPDFE